MRYYFGDSPLQVTTPPPPPPAPLPDWPIGMVSADATGAAVVVVRFVDETKYNKPDTILVAFIPGTALPATPEAALATAGVLTASAPFPTTFGPLSIDQNLPFSVTGLVPGTTYIVAAIGQFSS